MKKLKVCRKCWIYTFKDRCPKCSKKTETPHPPKYSPVDKWGKYRRRILEEKFFIKLES